MKNPVARALATVIASLALAALAVTAVVDTFAPVMPAKLVSGL